MADGFSGFSKDGVKFLAGIAKNNNKPWFEDNRAGYDDGLLAPGKLFVAELAGLLHKSVAPTVCGIPKVGKSIFRLHRDTRFSKDKSPYKTHFDMWLWDGDPDSKGPGSAGFYFRLTGKELMIGAGMHTFDKPYIEKYRAAVDDDKSGKALVAALKKVEAAGYDVEGGASLKRVPKPYDAEHARGELLKYKALTAGFSEKVPAAAYDKTLVKYVADRMKKLKPMHMWLKEHVAD